jgi:uncharacterized protein YecE (DUF72 family)
MARDPERLRNLLLILVLEIRYVFELRELSWITPQICSILREFNAAFCIYELAGYHSPISITADFTYVRLHGLESGKYQGTYGEQQLSHWARQIESWAKELKAIYLYFDNDQAGYAAANALRLREMIFGCRLKRAS